MARQTNNGERGMDGVEKAAILLIALGPEKSAEIFKHLKEEEIEQLTLEIANTNSVSPQTKEQVLNSIALKKRFCKNCNLPIDLFDEPYFSERLEILDFQFEHFEHFHINLPPYLLVKLDYLLLIVEQA